MCDHARCVKWDDRVGEVSDRDSALFPSFKVETSTKQVKNKKRKNKNKTPKSPNDPLLPLSPLTFMS